MPTVNGAIAEILRAEGCRMIAAFPGQGLIDAAASVGIRPIIPRQERAGVNIADGISRVTNGREIGVFTMQVGPGAENAFAGVAQAYADSVPILLLPGGAALSRHGISPSFDSARNYRAVTKWAVRLEDPNSAPDIMRIAFGHLRNGRPGPVLVEIPQDIANHEIPAPDGYRPASTYRSQGAPDDVEAIVERLLAADRPMMVAGQEVLFAGASGALVEFAELVGVPVMCRLSGKSAFPENHALSLGTAGVSATWMASRHLAAADFILGVGTSFTASYFDAALPVQAEVGQVTSVPEDLGKEASLVCGACGDVRLVLGQLIEAARERLAGRPRRTGAAEEIAQTRSAFRAAWEPRMTSDETPISPYRVIRALTEAVDPADTIITHDSGYPRDQLVPFWPAVTPRGYLGWGKSTQLGYGLGLSIGAKLAAPDKHVIHVMGDAAFGMAGMDLETAVRTGAATLSVVLNNGVMTNYAGQMPKAAEEYGTHRLGGDYTAIARGLGAHAERVEEPSALAGAIRAALASTIDGVPAVVEVMSKEEPVVPRYGD